MEIAETSNDTDKALKSIRRSVTNMNKQMKIIQRQFPEANFYHSDNCINVMASPSHEGGCGSPRQGDNILDSVMLHYSDGGGW